MNNKTNTNGGITLIALVITIIVLLILAGVSITTLMGPNGIIKEAKRAEFSSKIAKEKDELISAYSAAKIDKRGDKLEVTDLNKALAEDNVKANATVSTNPEGIKVKFTESQREYIITSDGKIQEGNIGGGNTPGPGTSKAEAGKYVTETKKDNYFDGKEYATVPKGFTVSGIPEEQKISEGLVIYDIPKNTQIDWISDADKNGMLDVQEKYNQFVWIPVNDFNDFKRRQGYSNGNFDPKNPEDIGEAELVNNKYTELVSDGIKSTTEVDKMYKSVKQNEGFYIGRYEAGNEDEKVVSKKGRPVWNNITWGDSMDNPGENGAVGQSRKMYNNDGKHGVASTLCYGVQWDETLKFLEGDYLAEGYVGYAKDSTKEGWYKDNYNNDNTGNNSTNPYHKTGIDLNYIKERIKKANQNKNIYDMAGNVDEWTMEAYSTNTRVPRGASYYRSDSGYPSSFRYNLLAPTSRAGYTGFRVTLYID